MCWRAGGTAKWSGVRMGGARAGGSKTGFVLRNERDVCGCKKSSDEMVEIYSTGIEESR